MVISAVCVLVFLFFVKTPTYFHLIYCCWLFSWLSVAKHLKSFRGQTWHCRSVFVFFGAIYCLFVAENKHVLCGSSWKLALVDKCVTLTLSSWFLSHCQWQHHVSLTFSTLSFSFPSFVFPYFLCNWHFVFVTSLLSHDFVPHSHQCLFLSLLFIDGCPIASVIKPSVTASFPSFPKSPSLLLFLFYIDSCLGAPALHNFTFQWWMSLYFSFAAFDWIP